MQPMQIWVNIRAFIRLLLFIFILAGFLAWSVFCRMRLRDPKKRLQQASRNVQGVCELILKVFKVKKVIIGKPNFQQNALIVSNHMGFVDILVIASLQPILFITSQEMHEAPVLGTITEMGACIYTERRSRTQIMGEVQKIVEALKNGFNVGLYPEATSTNGDRVLPFKRTLMTAAAHAGVPIQPVVVNFSSINHGPFDTMSRDSVCWYGPMPFHTALWNALKTVEVTVELTYLELIHSTLEDDRGVIADLAHAKISSAYRPPVKTSQIHSSLNSELKQGEPLDI